MNIHLKYKHALILGGDKLKGYQFINWNRDTFDFSSSRFLTEAYADKNYAFCSDF